MLYFEDFPEGETVALKRVLVGEKDVIAFAEMYDPQFFHLDKDAAKNSLLGGLAASGWHSCAILMRLMCDSFLLETASLGSPGCEEVRWLHPIRPGDVLSGTRTCLEARVSKSRPDRGICRISYAMRNQNDEDVLGLICTHFIGRRPENATPDGVARGAA